MLRKMIANVLGVPDAHGDKLAPWLTVVAMTAIIIGATVALVGMDSAPIEDSPVTVNR